jgi:hypothetical protein
MSTHSTSAIRSTWASIRSASRCRYGAHRAVDLRLARPRDLRDHPAVDRRDVLEALLGGDALAADVVVGRDRHPGDIDPLGERAHVNSPTTSESSTV